MVTHNYIEREVNGMVAVVWVSTPDRVLELRELLEEDGLLPADVMVTQARDAGFVCRRWPKLAATRLRVSAALKDYSN